FVRFISLNLSTSLPERTPQKSVIFANFSVVRLITNSPVSIRIGCEYLSFLTEIYAIGGSLQTVPVHATVIIFALPFLSIRLTITAGTGYTIFPAFHICFAIIFLPKLLFSLCSFFTV